MARCREDIRLLTPLRRSSGRSTCGRGLSHEVRRLQVAAVVEAGDSERSQVEGGFGAISDISDDIAHDGREPEPVPAHPGGDHQAARPALAVDHRQPVRRRIDLSGPGPPEPHRTKAGEVALRSLKAEPDIIEDGLGRQLVARGELQRPERGPARLAALVRSRSCERLAR